jgi:type IV secretory pathway component VirB8
MDECMSNANKQRQTSTQNADGSLLKYVAAFAIIAVMTLIAIVPFLITIMNATGPAAR